MDTSNVNICYRPIKVGWAIKSGDFDAFRKVIRANHALWGGRYNPIINIDNEAEANYLIDLYRLDLIIPVGECENVINFPKKYSFLINPFLQDVIFVKGNDFHHSYSNLLDIHNAIFDLHNKPELKEIQKYLKNTYSWKSNDPLSDIFLIQLGAYPDKDEIGIDYLKIINSAFNFDVISIETNKPIPSSTIDYPIISFLSRYNIDSHYSINTIRNNPGFYVGDSKSLDDLITHWNLRACNIPLWFIDPTYIDRFSLIISKWEKVSREMVSHYRSEWDRKISVWTRNDDIDEACKYFEEKEIIRYKISECIWNGHNLTVPMMYLGETSALGVMTKHENKTKISFSLNNKPFSGDSWFYQQHLITSINFIGKLYNNEQNTFHPPFIPELNEFYSRNMYFDYSKIRIEPNRIGIILDAADHDCSIYTLSIEELMKRMFKMVGYDACISNAGRITKQLIKQIGGLQGARVFKISGVRRLMKSYGPNSSITKKTALQMIGSKDPDLTNSNFNDHERLFIEPRPFNEKLTPNSVLGFLIDKDLYRIGVDIKCPSCNITSWIPLDTLKQKIICELCGSESSINRQLSELDKWYYRRSGILGVEKNAQGAIPVCLTLQQLDTNLHGNLDNCIYSPSLNLTSINKENNIKNEIDFIWLIPRIYPKKIAVILAECKDKGAITSDDISNLKTISTSFPKNRFDTFILLSKISPFSKEEIEMAKTINDDFNRRVILLSAKELEPYFISENTENKLNWFSPEEMANSTHILYFKNEFNNV